MVMTPSGKALAKQGIGTALSLRSKIWFTLEGGSLTEVFYPTADMANVQLMQFVVVDPRQRKWRRSVTMRLIG
jgi:glucoamylase